MSPLPWKTIISIKTFLQLVAFVVLAILAFANYLPEGAATYAGIVGAFTMLAIMILSQQKAGNSAIQIIVVWGIYIFACLFLCSIELGFFSKSNEPLSLTNTLDSTAIDDNASVLISGKRERQDSVAKTDVPPKFILNSSCYDGKLSNSITINPTCKHCAAISFGWSNSILKKESNGLHFYSGGNITILVDGKVKDEIEDLRIRGTDRRGNELHAVKEMIRSEICELVGQNPSVIQKYLKKYVQ